MTSGDMRRSEKESIKDDLSFLRIYDSNSDPEFVERGEGVSAIVDNFGEEYVINVKPAESRYEVTVRNSGEEIESMRSGFPNLKRGLKNLCNGTLEK